MAKVTIDLSLVSYESPPICPPIVLVSGDSSSKMTVKSVSGASLRPDGMLRDRDGLRVLAKVRVRHLFGMEATCV